MTVMTQRDYLASIGLTNAQRGRFSAAAKAALRQAKEQGIEFAEDAPKPQKERVIRKPQTEKVEKPAEALPNVDPKAVRSWAKQVGIALGERGRIPADIIKQYVAANGEDAETRPEVKVDLPKPERVRRETIAYGFVPRPEGSPQFVSEPLMGISECGRCTKGIAYCGCPDGPYMPKWAGGAQASLTKPV